MEWSNSPRAPIAALVVLGVAGCVPRHYATAAVELRRETDEVARGVVEAGSPPIPRSDDSLDDEFELSAFVALVLERSPELLALAHEVRSIVEDARAEGALPEPSLYVEVWNAPLTRPYALRQADMIMVGVSQSLPAPGVRTARMNARIAEARAALADLRDLEQELTERATTLYVDYVEATLEVRALDLHSTLVERMREAASARMAAGGGLGTVAQVESEAAMVARARVRADSKRARASVEINTLLGRAADAPLGPPGAAERASTDVAPESIDARAIASRGAARAARLRTDAAASRARAARYEARRPSFMFSVAWFQQPRAPAGVGGMVTMSLPWLSRGPMAREASARESAARADADALAAERTAVGVARAALVSVETLEAELTSLREGSIVAIERRLQAMPNAYLAGSVDLLDWIDAARQLLEAHLDEASTVADLGRAVAELERALGVRVGDAPVEVQP